MASQRKKRWRKYKRAKWIDTKYAFRYRKCLAIARFTQRAAMSIPLVSAMSRISAISASNLLPVEKKLKIAEITIAAYGAVGAAAKKLDPSLACKK